MQDARETTAQEFDRAAGELEMAARHLRTASRHFRASDVPRGCAHAFAAYGHMRRAGEMVDARAMIHAERAVPD